MISSGREKKDNHMQVGWSDHRPPDDHLVSHSALRRVDNGPFPNQQVSFRKRLIFCRYFCFLIFASFFVFDTTFFDKFHINYSIIFGLDNRDAINWRQLSELPSAFACILGVCMWLNSNPSIGPNTMYIYWPRQPEHQQLEQPSRSTITITDPDRSAVAFLTVIVDCNQAKAADAKL